MFERKVENGNMSSASCKGEESITKCGLVLGVSVTKWNIRFGVLRDMQPELQAQDAED